MNHAKKSMRWERQGVVLIISMIFILIFSALAVSMATLSGVNVQLADNQHKINTVFSAAQSGFEVGKYLVGTYTPTISTDDYITQADKDTTWQAFRTHVLNSAVWTDAGGDYNELVSANISSGSGNANFQLRFYYDGNSITLESTGSDGAVTRAVGINITIKKDNEPLKYAIAGRGRMIVTGDSTIDGPVFSTWYKPQWHAPVETTGETTVNGTINTVITLQQFEDAGMQMETLDGNDNPVFDEGGNRVYSPEDKVQGYHEGIDYGQPIVDTPGLDEDDYDTSMYESLCTDIPASDITEKEYFPHKPGDYTQKKDYWNYTYYRQVYENQTFTNARLPRGRNALFRNCTFEEVLFIDSQSYTGRKSKCNNVRFEDCQFNGVIVTDVPKNSSIKWVQNCLYFTGEAIFDNTSSIQEATILAPNFNVNLGNTAIVEEGSGSVLTGAVVGGIVDVRGNAQINGTIISMYDTSQHSSGYVTNIGFAEDGGSEGGVPEDVGVIHITVSPDQLLPSGIQSPVIIEVLQSTYSEGL